jgi:uncharacterized protein YcbX
MDIGSVAEIWRYPVSSLGGERLTRTLLGETGVEGDRGFGIVDPETGDVAAPEKKKRWRAAPTLAARLSDDGPEIATEEGWQGVDRPAAHAAIERHLGFPARIRPHAEAPPRYARAPIHLVTTASMARLQRLLPASAVTTRRFRPNLLVSVGEDEGFVETGWLRRTLAVGGARLRVREGCVRCAFTVIAQGELPQDPAILDAINRHGGTHLGVLCDVDAPGPVAAGDPVHLL